MHYARLISLIMTTCYITQPQAQPAPTSCRMFARTQLGDMLVLPRASQPTFISIEIKNTPSNLSAEDLSASIEPIPPADEDDDGAAQAIQDISASVVKDPGSQKLSVTMRIPAAAKPEAITFIAKIETPCVTLVGAYSFKTSIARPETLEPLLLSSIEVPKPSRRKRIPLGNQSTWSAANNGGLPRLIAPLSPY